MGRNQTHSTERGTAEKGRATVLRLMALILVTMTVFAVYRFFLGRLYFEITLGIYMVLATVLILSYVIYNRGLSRRRLTEDMLPADWSEEQKREFFADGERRLRRSRWMLIPIFAFLFTFAFDLLELFILPTVRGFFS
jgi:hypothetical protein